MGKCLRVYCCVHITRSVPIAFIMPTRANKVVIVQGISITRRRSEFSDSEVQLIPNKLKSSSVLSSVRRAREFCKISIVNSKCNISSKKQVYNYILPYKQTLQNLVH